MNYIKYQPPLEESPNLIADVRTASVPHVSGEFTKTAPRTVNTPQPPPTGCGEVVGELVIADIKERMAMGREKYGTYLRTHNGRVALIDLYQELIDAVLYLRQAIAEAT